MIDTQPFAVNSVGNSGNRVSGVPKRAPGILVTGSFTWQETTATQPDVASQRLFDNLEFRLMGGAWNCLLGTSGIGKSTLLRLIAGLQTEGYFDGQIAADDALPIVDRIAYMAQSDLLFPWLSVERNIATGAVLRRQSVNQERLEQLLIQTGLAEHRRKKPGELSGGMRQRTALARTLMEDTAIVLLDEPFSALDTRTRAEMQELAFTMLHEKTVLLVTHDASEALRLGHHIYTLSTSGLKACGLPDELPLRDLATPTAIDAQRELLLQLNA